MTSYGVTPAEYSTGDVVKQRIIENSDHFKNGRIYLVRKTGKPDPVKSRVEKRDPLQTQEAQIVKDPELTKTSVPEPKEVTNEAGKDSFIDQAADEAEEVSPQEVAVSCLTDAQNYLRDNFGIATSKSRSVEKAQTYARENGIVFVGI